MEAFRSTLDDYELVDIGYSGRWYTWERGNFEANNIRERLDRGVANLAWTEMFPFYRLIHIDNSISDHCPLLLETDLSTSNGTSSNSTCLFRFETAWLLEDSCYEQVRSLWVSNKNASVPERLTLMGEGLRRWASNLKRERGANMKKLSDQLNKLSEEDPSDDIIGAMIRTKLETNLEIDKEELYWEQRARSNWLRYVDRNTSFFHNLASSRHRKNKITGLKDQNGNIMETDEGLMRIATSYFKGLFASERCREAGKIFEGVQKTITVE
ncbi:hypothetical protein V6Z11_D11G008600 [Gossypium hirsutum]